MKKLNKIHEVEIIYKRPALSSMEQVKNSNSIVKIFRSLIRKDKIDLKEFFMIALLSNSNHVLGVSEIGSGTLTGTLVNIKEIFQLVIKSNATAIILCHNHPSGKLKVSKSDESLTEKVNEICNLCDIKLLDHIIITSEGYYSFADKGVL